MKEHRIVGALCLGLALICIAGITRAQAAPDVTFSISASGQGPGKAVPTLTWSTTTPAPTGCAASGDAAWSGAKAASGVLVLPSVTSNKNYVMACTFATDTQALVTWSPPTSNTDGTPLTDLASYNVYWNSGDPSLVTAPTGKVKSVAPAATPAITITNLAAGNWYFAVTAINAMGVESALSNIATKTIGAAAVITKNAALVFPGTVVVTVK